MNTNFIYCIVFIFFILSCNEDYNHPLGNNLSIWEGDKKEDRVIVYCEGNCHGGIYVVPNYSRHYDSTGHYAEYVETAKSDKEWVIVKTLRVKDKRENYYIISKDFDIVGSDCATVNCDSILQSRVTEPLNLTEFENKKKALKIEFDFK